MATIFIDEAGNSGTNLLDASQPVFVLASHDLTLDECLRLRGEYFGKVKADSLKFSQLRRRSIHQKAIIRFLGDMKAQHPSRFACIAMHKPFVLMAKIVDMFVEESMHRRGVNLYEQGGNLALANALYAVTGGCAGKEYLWRILKAAQRFFLSDSLSPLVDLISILEEKTGLMRGKERKRDPLGEFLSIPQLAILDLDREYLTRLDRSCLSLPVSSALCIMAVWSERHGPNLDIVHDDSSQMLKHYDAWVKTVAPGAPAALIGFDRRTMKFPIGVNSTTFERDENSVGLQIADLVAGAVASTLPFFWDLKTKPNEFETALIATIEGWTLDEHISPSQKFTAEDLGTDGPLHQDPFDYYNRLHNSGKRDA